MQTHPPDLETVEYLPVIVHAYVWLKSHPVTEHLAADLIPLKQTWKDILLKEVQLSESVAEAEARILLSDFDLDTLQNAIINALMTAANNDRSSVLITRFLGKDRASEIRAPILGEQLDRLRTWPPGLATVPSEEAKKLGLALAAFVPKADLVVEAQRKAEQEMTDFVELTERRAFVDSLNATCKLLYGKISELMHTPAGASLPSDFADRCFPPQTRSRRPTIKSEERAIERLKSQLARHEAILADLKEKRDASEKAREEAEQAAILSEAEALKKEAQEKLAKATALELKLKKPIAQ
jgi:hypothetical protein